MPELPIDTSASAVQMAETIFGDSVQVVSATYTGDNDSSGIYTNGDTISPGVTPGDSGIILSTGEATDFTNATGQPNQSTNNTSPSSGPNNLSYLNDVAGARTYDASILEIEFIPTGNVMTMQFVFASDEYPEYVNSIYQDFVAVWINGELVPLEIGNGDVDPGNVNDGDNSSLFVDNTNDAYNTEMDGFTLTMTLTMEVDPSLPTNTMVIAIADVADSSYDSSLLIAADSVQTDIVAQSDLINIGLNGTKTVDLLANDINTGSVLTLTQINGQDVVIDQPILLPTGQTITVHSDGTVTITADGDEEVVNLTYTIENENGDTDVGFVTINAAPCFVSGTLIRTPYGDIPVEDLDVGDLVDTYDHGAQPVRWIGQRTVPAEGNLAPIRIAAKTYGEHGTLLVSPQHRVLIRNSLAEVLFGESEVLIAAKDLVNDSTVSRQVGGDVTYFHLLFDRHQIVFSQGLETESFLPGPQITNIFEAETVEEIRTLFPEIDLHTGDGYCSAVRPSLKSFEAGVLLRKGSAA